MNHTLILQRAFTLVRRYRVLWILGILLALTAAGGSGNGNVTLSDRSPFGNLNPEQVSALVGGIMVLVCLLGLLVIVTIVVRYIVQAGLYRSVEQIEDIQEAPSFRQAFRLGWSFRTFRLFLINLLIAIPTIIVALVFLALALSPLLLLIVESEGVRIFAAILTVGLVLFVILLIIVIGAFLQLVLKFAHRSAVLDDRGPLEAIRQGFHMVREQLQDVAIMWLLMAGIGLGFGLLMIPVVILLGLLALLLGGGPAWLLYAATESIAGALLLGLPIALIIFAVPLMIISGYYEAFKSAVWTLTYREVRALSI